MRAPSLKFYVILSAQEETPCPKVFYKSTCGRQGFYVPILRLLADVCKDTAVNIEDVTVYKVRCL